MLHLINISINPFIVFTSFENFLQEWQRPDFKSAFALVGPIKTNNDIIAGNGRYRS